MRLSFLIKTPYFSLVCLVPLILTINSPLSLERSKVVLSKGFFSLRSNTQWSKYKQLVVLGTVIIKLLLCVLIEFVVGFATPVFFGEYTREPEVVMFSLNNKVMRFSPFFMVLSTEIKTGDVVSLSPPDGGTGLAQNDMIKTTSAMLRAIRVSVIFLLIIDECYLPKCTRST